MAVAARDGESAELSCHAVTAALGDLTGQGVTITAVPEVPAADGARGQAGWVPHAAKATRAPWVAPWQAGPQRSQGRDYDESYLLDLACARECAQADAVGYAGGSGYAYVTSLDPALARAEFFGPDGTENSARGLRLFSLS